MKNGLRYFTFCLMLASLSSCVGNKKLVYLQNKEAKGVERYKAEITIESKENLYTIKSGDVLYVRIQKFVVGEELFQITGFEQATRIGQMQHPFLQGYNVTADGFIDLPLLGRVQADGLTLDDLQARLKLEAMKEYPGSVVELFLLDGMISVLGEVNHAGRYPLYKSKNTIFDVVSQAGDLKDYADRSSVKIIREVDGKTSVFHLDMNSIKTLSQEGYYLQNNDIVIVNPLRRRKYVTTNIQWLISSVTALVAIASLVVTINR